MTEREWLACKDPRKMYAQALRFGSARLKKVRRKFRLYACACCRQIWPLLGKPSRAAVEISERYAEDEKNTAELRRACAGAEANVRESGHWQASWAASMASSSGISQLARRAAMIARRAARAASDKPLATFTRRGQQQCDLLRDIFGNSFRPAAVDPAWLAWNDRIVVQMAQTIYEERAFDRMPVLGDALEEAGCNNADILNHCRQPGQHVRGCRVVDLLLGKA